MREKTEHCGSLVGEKMKISCWDSLKKEKEEKKDKKPQTTNHGASMVTLVGTLTPGSKIWEALYKLLSKHVIKVSIFISRNWLTME